MKHPLTLILLLATMISSCNHGWKAQDKYEKLKTDHYSDYFFTLRKNDSKSVLDSIKALADFSAKDSVDYLVSPNVTLFVNDDTGEKFQVFENSEEIVTAIAYFQKNQEIKVAEYHENGQVMCLFSVSKEGVREGRYECYDDDGSLRTIGVYKNDKEVSDSTRQFDKIIKVRSGV